MSSTDTSELEFAGFWLRVGASLIDTLIGAVIIVPFLWSAYGPAYFDSTALVAGPFDFLVTWVLPAIATILFWIYEESTPGKMALGIRVVDATTGAHASTGQYVGRYFAYYLSLIPLGLGFLWVGWDPRKQGWHDRLANTVVVRRRRVTESPSFRPPSA